MSEEKPQPKAAPSNPEQPHSLDLEGTYSGDMKEVITAYRRDAQAAKKRWEALEPARGQSLEQMLGAYEAQAWLYLGLRNKLARVNGAQLWSAQTADVLDRAARRDNQALRDKALLAAGNGARAWSQKCEQELAAAEQLVAQRAGVVWRYSLARPGFEAMNERARQVLAALQAQRGDGWLTPLLSAAKLESRTGMFGTAPSPSPLPPCTVLPNVVAPLGPLVEGTAALPDGMVLPDASRVVTALGEGPRVYLSARGTYWGRERKKVASVAALATLADDPAAPKKVEVLLFADGATPHHLVVGVLSALSGRGYFRYLLVTRSSEPNSVRGLPLGTDPIEGATLNIGVQLVNLGYAMVVGGKRVGADCGAGDPAGMAVPRVASKLDAEGLGRCLSKLLPARDEEVSRVVALVANPSAPYSELIASTEALAAHATVVWGILPGAAP